MRDWRMASAVCQCGETKRKRPLHSQGRFALYVAHIELVPRVGIEPTRCHHHRILSPARLPVPPPRQSGDSITTVYRRGQRARQLLRVNFLRLVFAASPARGTRGLLGDLHRYGVARMRDAIRRIDIHQARLEKRQFLFLHCGVRTYYEYVADRGLVRGGTVDRDDA